MIRKFVTVYPGHIDLPHVSGTAPIPLRLNLAGSPGCAGRMWVVADSTRDAQAALDGRR